MERAQAAGEHAGETVRVGTSIMTPNRALMELWPQVRDRCPDLRLRIVPFENTVENARQLLGNLGDEIDVVCGVYDEGMLALRRCVGHKLRDEPVRVAVRADDELASCDVVGYGDLAGRHLMLMQRGWSSTTDAMRADLAEQHPEVIVEDFSFYDVEAFNRCEREGAAIMTVYPWADVHPLLTVKPVAWDYAIPYGILHAPHPSARVRRLLDAVV